MNKLHKSALIGLGALALSTVAIQASDIVSGVRDNLAGIAIESQSVCDDGAVLILMGSHSLCIDMYEASAGEACPHQVIDSQVDVASPILLIHTRSFLHFLLQRWEPHQALHH